MTSSHVLTLATGARRYRVLLERRFLFTLCFQAMSSLQACMSIVFPYFLTRRSFSDIQVALKKESSDTDRLVPLNIIVDARFSTQGSSLGWTQTKNQDYSLE